MCEFTLKINFEFLGKYGEHVVKEVFTAAAGSAEVVIMLKSCVFVGLWQGLDTFIRTVLLAFRTSSRGILGHIISHG